MVQQWFLDLDGVRSGPYQTPEVLGLIAEGEVLPHHRISTSLKDQPWTTVLEWRLEQAKLESAASQKKSYIPEGEATGVKPQKQPLTWNDPRDSAVTPQAPSPSKEVGAVDLNPEAAEDEIEEVIQVLQANTPIAEPVAEAPVPPTPTPASTPTASHIVLEPKPKHEPPAHHAPQTPPPQPSHPTHATEPPAEAPTVAAPAPVAPGARKRDPMAEMFDMLQNTKHKREAKEKAAHHPSPSHEKGHRSESAPAASPSWGKTAIIGLLITLAGFMLGQLFQQSGDKKEPLSNPITATEKNITAPAQPMIPPAHKAEVIDRSTDKITIRAKVDRTAEPPVAIPRKAQAAATPELSAKDAQEIKDLKKELQELKALKEELKNAPHVDDGSDIPMDENYLTAPSYNDDANGGAAYSPNDAVDPNSGNLPAPPPHDPNQPPVNY